MLRKEEKKGGGLAIGVVPDVNPVWLSEGTDDIEVLVVQVEIDQLKLRCMTAYWPQEKHLIERKVNGHFSVRVYPYCSPSHPSHGEPWNCLSRFGMNHVCTLNLLL